MAHRLNGILVDHFLSPLQQLLYRTVCIIDCLNYGTMYPAFFDRVDIDPNVYYVFVLRGSMMGVPDKTRGNKRFATTCVGPARIIEPNVMVISVCSSYMYSIQLGRKDPRCSFSCRVSEGLYNLWSLSSGSGLSGKHRIPPFLSLVNNMADDACQLDDFIIGVVSAVLTRAGKHAEIYSGDGRFFDATVELPKIRYPFYMVVTTSRDRVGVPVYQHDCNVLHEALNHTPNPDYIEPYHDDEAPLWRRTMDTKRKMDDRKTIWIRAKSTKRHEQIPLVDVARKGLESPVAHLEETQYEDPVTPDEYDFLQREAFDAVEDGHDPDCAHVTEQPAMRSISLEDMQRLGSTGPDAALVSRGSRRRSHRRV